MLNDFEDREFTPVPDWKVNTFFAIMATVDLVLIGWAVWFFYVHGWL